MKSDLPQPSPQEIERSTELQKFICGEIANCHGSISFERFMQLCLYANELGYYTSGGHIFGEQGDFVTSSERGNLFAQAFVAHLIAIQEQLKDFNIIEIGAGSGRFAVQLFSQLKTVGLTPDNYYIIETSAALRKRQQEYLSAELRQDIQRIKWLDQIDATIARAVVIANEVLDALPVRLFTAQNSDVLERRVQVNTERGFEFVTISAEQSLRDIVQKCLPTQVLDELDQPYHSEICVEISNFIQQIAASVDQGIFFFVDYGYPRSEYYHVQRTMGTLLCHYRHRAHDDPLRWPGLQDLSCNVDFTALAEAGTRAGLELNCYGTQAHFLLASNFLANIENQQQDTLRNNNQLKQLMMPGEMGERFQVMVFTKQLALDNYQFTIRDLCHRL